MTSKRVLVFGSGLVARAVLVYFTKQPGYEVIMASADRATLDKIGAEFTKNLKCVAVDINDRKTCAELVSQSDVVLSLLPPPLHPKVVEYCLEVGRDLVTSSYLTPEIMALNERAKQKGVSILFELGLDPGIDHVATLKIIDDIRKKGGKIKSMYSFCGGLISPDCVDNPLAYKFSWSPLGAFRALLNDATFLENGQKVTVKAKDLLYAAKPFNVNNALNVIYYPNRDSLKYQEIYNLKEAKTVVRGTFRYKGFAEIIAAFQELGLLADVKATHSNWRDHINSHVSKSKLNKSILSKNDVKYLQEKFPGIDYIKLRFEQILGAVTSHKIWQTYTKDAILARMALILDGLEHFGFLTDKMQLDAKKSVLENFVDTLLPFLTLKPEDTDSILMTIKFEVEYPDFRAEDIVFQFVTNGEKQGHSAMSRTVGTSAAIGAKLLVDKKIVRKGVYGPFTEDVYTPVYEEMVREGLVPKYVVKSFKPKL